MNTAPTLVFVKPTSIVEGRGAERWVLEVTKRLYKKYHIVYIGMNWYNQWGIELSELVEFLSEVNYIEIRGIKLPKGWPIPYLNEYRRMIKYIRSADLVYVFTPNPWIELLLYPIAKSVLAGVHSQVPFNQDVPITYKFYEPIVKEFLRRARAVHVLSHRSKKTLAYRWGVDESKIFVVPNGVDVSKFKCVVSQQKTDEFTILFVGALEKSKGLPMVLELAKELCTTYNDIKFFIAGEGSLRSIVELMSKKYSCIAYFGKVPYEKMPQIYNLAHVVILPSRLEGLPLTVLEACACGIPVITYHNPNLLEVFSKVHMPFNLLVYKSGLYEWKKKILWLYNMWKLEYSKYKKLRYTISRLTAKYYDWNIIVDKLDRMFRHLMSS